MLKRSSIKKCRVDGCDSPVHWGGLCRYHYNKKQAAKQALKLPKRTPLRRYTAKRSSEVTQYHKTRKSFIEEQRALHPQGKIYCIFCNKEIIGNPSLHHSLGRDEDLLLDTKFWFLSHNNCHVNEYHSMSCKDISWWSDYMNRMKKINLSVYTKDLIRQEKTNTLKS